MVDLAYFELDIWIRIFTWKKWFGSNSINAWLIFSSSSSAFASSCSSIDDNGIIGESDWKSNKFYCTTAKKNSGKITSTTNYPCLCRVHTHTHSHTDKNYHFHQRFLMIKFYKLNKIYNFYLVNIMEFGQNTCTYTHTQFSIFVSTLFSDDNLFIHFICFQYQRKEKKIMTKNWNNNQNGLTLVCLFLSSIGERLSNKETSNKFVSK